jgi:hypothetical protein
VLAKIFRPGEIYTVNFSYPGAMHGTYAELTRLTPEQQRGLRLVSGHMPFGLRDHFADPRDWHYVTFLRDPIRRTVSAYHQVRSSPQNPAHELAKALSLEEFVRRRAGGTFNVMTRWLSNEAFGEQFASPEAMFDRAVANAEACSFIGITDLYQESVRRLCARFGWRRPKVDTRYALTPKDLKLSPSELQAIVEANEYDQRLYDLFRQRFERERSFASRLIRGIRQWLRPSWLSSPSAKAG